ncbi:hypothetical protein GCM10022291_25030 [Postechiella marina]|uniref:GH16 domain-containing protein n=1 Tax=Postechiella marina TaxID=943941 RepID=A0ABP8CCN7_9FLAO
MNFKKITAFIVLVCIGNLIYVQAQSGPPKPPIGKRWVLNPDFSDEFNGTELDTDKWLDNHPTWKGREPGLFMSSQVSVKDGYLQIRGEKMKKDTIINAYNREMIFNVKGGAVVSKKAAFLGYYETKMKASATTMSATFWFSTSKTSIGPNDCDKYGLEWDIQECIGRKGDFKGSFFASGMHSNAHFWYTDCEKKKHDYRAAQVRFEDDEVASKDFHVYGGWWRDESSASYYYDNRAPKHQYFYDKVKKKPFDKPMYMRLVCETYPFPWIELPNDEELADPSKNVVYYDWVRGYKLVDFNDESHDTKQENPIRIYDEGVIFDSESIDLKSSKALKIPLSYKANKDRVISFLLKDSEGKNIVDQKITAYAGYANFEYDLKLKSKLKPSNTYVLLVTTYPIGDKKSFLDKSTLLINITK